MASSLSILGIFCETEEDKNFYSELASDTDLDKETRMIAAIVAHSYGAISFGKLENILEEIGVFEDSWESFKKYGKVVRKKWEAEQEKKKGGR